MSSVTIKYHREEPRANQVSCRRLTCVAARMGRAGARFDRQAEDYDRRASLPEDVCRSAVRGLKTLAGLQPDDVFVEVGVGSGQLSRWLCREPITYIGFDVSQRMLELCARKFRPWRGGCL